MESIPYENSRNRRPITERNGVPGKECVYCGNWKPLEGGFTKGPYDGKDHRCRECKKLKNQKPSSAIVIDDTPRQIGYAILRYEGAEIAFEMDRSQVSLTDLWIAAGRPENKEPRFWLYQDGTTALLVQYAQQTNSMLDTVCGARQGSHGGTWAPREIALAYAMYLNPALHLAVLQFVIGRADEFAQSAAPSQALELMQQLMRQQNAVLAAVGLLPGIKQDTSGIRSSLSGVEFIKVKQIIRCQVYIFRLLPNSPFYELAMRKCRTQPRAHEHVIAIGRTGADGDVHELRLADYGGKFPFQPSDYELLSVIQTDKEDSEGVLLRHPMEGCARFYLPNGGRSKTFLTATDDGLNAYRSFTSGYYTHETLCTMFDDGTQLGLWKHVDG